MNTKDYIQQDLETKRKEYIFDFIRQKELINSVDNVIFSQKAFIINSVLNWCIDLASKDKMNRNGWSKYNKLLGQYIAGIIDIKWKDGAPEIIEIPQDDKTRPQRRRRKQIK